MKRFVPLALLAALLLPSAVHAAFGTLPAEDWCRTYMVMSEVLENEITDQNAWQDIYNNLDGDEVSLCAEVIAGLGAQSVVYEFSESLSPSMTQRQGVNGMFNGTGTYVVGVDIEPGTYRASSEEGCYWVRMSDFSGGIVANDFEGRTIVTIEPSDAGFHTEDCGTWGPVQ